MENKDSGLCCITIVVRRYVVACILRQECADVRDYRLLYPTRPYVPEPLRK